MSDSLVENLNRALYVKDESSAGQSVVKQVYPLSIIDQIFDDQSPTNQTLREILEDLRYDISTGAMGNIVFPVTSVNTLTGDVVLNKSHVGLMNVDNTADIEKPLSTPQRLTILEMLETYDFKINLNDLTDHINNFNNPHKITMEQLDANGDLTSIINRLISIHSYSTDNMVHLDIRNAIAETWSYTQSTMETLTASMNNTLNGLDAHLSDTDPHPTQMNNKEDISNKLISIDSDSVDHISYPSSRAVSEFISQEITKHSETHPEIDDWMPCYKVVDSKSDLPAANEDSWRKLYFIRYGDTSRAEVARCIRQSDMTFTWEYSSYGPTSKFDPEWFEETPDGMTLRVAKMIDAIIDENGMLDTSLSEILKDYVTVDQSNDKFITAVTIVPGTMDGHIQYYINDDLTTRSDDIAIPGLKNLAYMEWITEDNINDDAVHERHILNRAVSNRTIEDKAVTSEKIYCPKDHIIANLSNNNNFGECVPINSISDLVADYILTTATNPGVIIPSIYEVGTEYDIGSNNYIQRFTGSISAIANYQTKDTLSISINYANCKLVNVGGSWEYQSDPGAMAMLGGSNITGHTFATVTMDTNGTYFETISTGKRESSYYDIWIHYEKTV